MEFSSLLPPAIVLYSLALPRPRARVSLSGGVIVALALASLRVAGGTDWRGAGLPATYLSITAALLLLGALFSLGQAFVGPAGVEAPLPRRVAGLGGMVVLGLTLWVAAPLALAGGLGWALIALLILAASLGVFRAVGRWLMLSRRLHRLDQRLFGRIQPGPTRMWTGRDAPLLALHLALAAVALFAPHLVLLLAAVVGTAATGALLERRVDSSMRWPWAMSAGLGILALAGGCTIAIAGEVPLALEQLRDGPFSPAFEPAAALAWLAAVWPLLRLWPFHSHRYGPATSVAGAAILIRVTVPILPGGTQHWQPLIFPLLVLSAWYAAGLGRVRLALASVATAGLISLRPGAAWAGVILLLGGAATSIGGRFGPAERYAPGIAALAALVLMAEAVPLLAGALQTQTFYTVLLAVGLAVTLSVDESAEDQATAR
jgi:hypothetical protein